MAILVQGLTRLLTSDVGHFARPASVPPGVMVIDPTTLTTVELAP